jgi:hypothetical protein
MCTHITKVDGHNDIQRGMGGFSYLSSSSACKYELPRAILFLDNLTRHIKIVKTFHKANKNQLFVMTYSQNMTDAIQPNEQHPNSFFKHGYANKLQQATTA